MQFPFKAIMSATSRVPFISAIMDTKAVAVQHMVHVQQRAKYSRSSSAYRKIPWNSQNDGHHYSTNSITLENQPPSWLFVSGAVAGAYGAQVNLDLDLDKRLSGEALHQLKSNVTSRGIQCDVDGLVADLEKLRSMERYRSELSEARGKIVEKIKLLKTDMGSLQHVKETLQDLTEKLSKVKLELSNSAPLLDLEERVMINALRLPNELHESTPLTDSVITRKFEGKTGTPSTLSHVEIAKKFNLIKFSNVGPKAYYLKGDLVTAEMALSDTVCQYLQSKNYRLMAGPEFCKSPIVEGCGQDVRDADMVLTMLDDLKDVVEPMNHLTGVSPAMFVAYVAKTCIGDNALPLNMFACGRRYQNGHLPGLYGAVQSTQAGFFSCVTKENLDRQFHETIDVIWEFLEPFGFPLRLCQNSARELNREERRRCEIQIFAPSLNVFIPVASVSDLGDFVSRRLMVIHNKNHADIRSADLVHMVSGVALNVTSLLAVWMEYSKTDEHCLVPSLEQWNGMAHMQRCQSRDKALDKDCCNSCTEESPSA